MSNEFAVAYPLTSRQERALLFAAQQQWIHDSAKAMKEVQALVYNWTFGGDGENILNQIRKVTATLGEYPDG